MELLKLIFVRMLPISLISMVPVVGGVVCPVDALFVLRGDRRCIHDLLAGTKVVAVDSARGSG